MTVAMNVEQFRVSANFTGVANFARLQDEPADMVSFVYGTPAPPRMMDVAKAFLEENYPEYTMAAILGDSRMRPLVQARHHVWWEVRRQRPDASWMAMGRRFKRDHTSILHGVRKHAERMAANGVVCG